MKQRGRLGVALKDETYRRVVVVVDGPGMTTVTREGGREGKGETSRVMSVRYPHPQVLNHEA